MAVGNLEFIKSVNGTSVSSLEVTYCFSDDYDVYYISITDFANSSAQNLRARFIDSTNSVITGAEYQYANYLLRSYGAFSESSVTSSTNLGEFCYDKDDLGTGLSLYIYNPYNSSTYTFTQVVTSNIALPSGQVGRNGMAVHKSAEQITGIQFYPNADTINNLTVNVFGVK